MGDAEQDRVRPTCRIRPAGQGDAAVLAAIHLETAIVAYAGLFPPDAPPPPLAELTDLWAARIEAADDDARARSLVLVAESDDGAVGVVAVAPEPPGDARLLGFYVRPEAWDAGHGRALHAAVLSLVTGHADALHAWVLEGNERGRRWYHRHGYRPTGERLAIMADRGIFDEGWRLALP